MIANATANQFWDIGDTKYWSFIPIELGKLKVITYVDHQINVCFFLQPFTVLFC